MATISTQVRIDETTKKQAVELLEGLGLNLSDAINMFLKQVVLQNGIPFDVKYPILLIHDLYTLYLVVFLSLFSLQYPLVKIYQNLVLLQALNFV
mgnify:CR=1 FL=1